MNPDGDNFYSKVLNILNKVLDLIKERNNKKPDLRCDLIENSEVSGEAKDFSGYQIEILNCGNGMFVLNYFVLLNGTVKLLMKDFTDDRKIIRPGEYYRYPITNDEFDNIEHLCRGYVAELEIKLTGLDDSFTVRFANRHVPHIRPVRANINS